MRIHMLRHGLLEGNAADVVGGSSSSRPQSTAGGGVLGRPLLLGLHVPASLAVLSWTPCSREDDIFCASYPRHDDAAPAHAAAAGARSARGYAWGYQAPGAVGARCQTGARLCET